jgi:uncharacterized protein
MLNPELLKILCCPLGKADLKLENNFLVCIQCGLKFPIREDIPILLLEEAVLPDGVKDLGELKCQQRK